MVMRSIQPPMPARDSTNKPAPKVTAPTSARDRALGSLTVELRASPQASSMFIREVMPAKNTDRKKNTAKSCPPGICSKTWGRVTNMRAGPLVGSMPKANTAGMMAKPASRAARVSSTAVIPAWRRMLSLFFI